MYSTPALTLGRKERNPAQTLTRHDVGHMHLRHSCPVLPQGGAPLAVPIALVGPASMVGDLLLRLGDCEVQADARQGPAASRGVRAECWQQCDGSAAASEHWCSSWQPFTVRSAGMVASRGGQSSLVHASLLLVAVLTSCSCPKHCFLSLPPPFQDLKALVSGPAA